MSVISIFGGYLKADTTTIVHIGPFVDVTDGFTPETGVTLGAADEAEILKHGATSTTDISGNTWNTIAGCDGHYVLTILDTQLTTEGHLSVIVQDASVCRPVRVDFEVVNANVYDSLFAASGVDVLNTETASMAANVVTAAAINAAAIDNAAFAADVGSTAYATNIIALASRKAFDELNLDHLMKVPVADRDALAEVVDDTVLANIMTKTDGDTSDFDHATDSLEAIRDRVDVVEGETVEIGTAGAGLTDLGGFATAALAEIQSECNDALVALNLDHIAAVAVANNADMSAEVVDGSVLCNIMTKGSDTSDYTVATDSLEGLSDALVIINDLLDPEIAEIKTAVETTLDDHLTDIKGTGFVKDTNSLVNQSGTPGVQKNVALSNFSFTMIDSSDNISPKTGLTVVAQIAKDGAAFVAAGNAVSEISNGWYKIDFTQAEMNYDTLAWRFTATGANDRNFTVTTS